MKKFALVSFGFLMVLLAEAIMGALPISASTPANSFAYNLTYQGMGERDEVHDNPAVLPGNTEAIESIMMAFVKSGSGFVWPDSVRLVVGSNEVVMTEPTISEPALEYRANFTEQLSEDGLIEVIGVGTPHFFTPRAAYRIDKIIAENINGVIIFPSLKAYAISGTDEKVAEIEVLTVSEKTQANLVLAASDVSDDGRIGALGYSVDGGLTWTDQMIYGTDDEELAVWNTEVSIPANTSTVLVRVQSIADSEHEGQSIYLSVAILNQEIPAPPETPTPSPSPTITPSPSPSPTPTLTPPTPPPPDENYSIFLPLLQSAKAPCTSRWLNVEVIETGMKGRMDFAPWPGNAYANVLLPYGSHLKFTTSDGVSINSSITWFHDDDRMPGLDGWYHYFPLLSEWLFTATFDSEDTWEDLTPGHPWKLDFSYVDQNITCNNSIPAQWDPPNGTKVLIQTLEGLSLILK